jgi:hypothetical protein
LLRTTYARDFPEIVVNNQDCERSEFSLIVSQCEPRPSELWGRSEIEGTSHKKPYATKAFNHLRDAGYQNIGFVPPSSVKGHQTPDLQADGALCEVKTINISEVEADRRDNGGVGTSTDYLDEGFFRKLSSDLRKAKAQMAAYGAGQNARHIAYVIVNFDDRLHEYADRYQRQIDRYIAGDPVGKFEAEHLGVGARLLHGISGSFVSCFCFNDR